MILCPQDSTSSKADASLIIIDEIQQISKAHQFIKKSANSKGTAVYKEAG